MADNNNRPDPTKNASFTAGVSQGNGTNSLLDKIFDTNKSMTARKERRSPQEKAVRASYAKAIGWLSVAGFLLLATILPNTRWGEQMRTKRALEHQERKQDHFNAADKPIHLDDTYRPEKTKNLSWEEAVEISNKNPAPEPNLKEILGEEGYKAHLEAERIKKEMGLKSAFSTNRVETTTREDTENKVGVKPENNRPAEEIRNEAPGKLKVNKTVTPL